MKIFNKISIVMLLAITLLSSCKKEFLDRPPLDQLVADNFYSDTRMMRMATAALYCRPWWDFSYPFLFDVGDVMAGNAYNAYTPVLTYANFTIADGESGLKYGWSSLYNVIANSNTTIINIQTLTSSSISAADKNAAIAEARFTRGTAYFYLVRLWGSVPIITNNSDLVQNPQVPRIIETDVLKFILKDLKFAATYLKSSDDAGRVTSWSAKGMISKVYLTLAGKEQNGGVRNQADLDSAKLYAGDVCKNSGITLLPSYYNLFLRAYMNNPESLFSLQWVSKQDWGSQNWWQAFLSPDGNIAAVGDGNWAGVRVSYDLYKSYVAGDLRRKACFMVTGDSYPEFITTANPNGYSITTTTNTGSDAGIKKYVIGGPMAPGNTNAVASMQTDIHTYILRLSDVYLTYAESILGNASSTVDEDALKYFNLVRTRAGISSVTSINADSIMKERRCEFSMEGQFWFDLLRLHDYKPQAAVAFIQNQNRASFSYVAATGETANDTIQVTPTESSFRLPYPAVDVTSNPKLTQDPVPYTGN